jgi:hypothetical protein
MRSAAADISAGATSNVISTDQSDSTANSSIGAGNSANTGPRLLISA